jgi:hypothetical protein
MSFAAGYLVMLLNPASAPQAIALAGVMLRFLLCRALLKFERMGVDPTQVTMFFIG